MSAVKEMFMYKIEEQQNKIDVICRAVDIAESSGKESLKDELTRFVNSLECDKQELMNAFSVYKEMEEKTKW